MIQKIREKLNMQTVIRVVPTALFLLFIFSVMIFTYTDKVKKAVTDTKLSVESLEKLSDSFEGTLQDNIYDKNNYIDINGLTTRILGINSLNERQRLVGGQLTDFGNAVDISKHLENTIELNAFLEDRGIDFVYVLAPCKRAFYATEFEPGYSSTVKESYDAMAEELGIAGLNVIAMNSWFKENGWTIDDVYYKTDHHWRTEAGLAAAKETMELLSELDIADYNEDTLVEDNWTVNVYKNWFLGSSGKRTGATYVGTDDISVYIPNFKTDYEYSYLKKDTTTWTYTDTILNSDYLEEKDYFKDNPYSLYMIGDYPNRITRNSEATNDKRLLLMGDSFKMPYEYFLTTQFKEVYTVDLRYTNDNATFVQYIEEFHPDIVIMCSNSVSNDDLYTFGVPEYLTTLKETKSTAPVNALGDFAIEAGENDKDFFTVVCDNLEPGETYTLTVDVVEYSGGDDHHIQMTLQNLFTNKDVGDRYFEVDSKETQKWIFTVPEDIASYSVYLYAGTKGHTANVLANISNVTLRKGIFED